MAHHAMDKKVEKKNPLPNNMKTTPVTDSYFKESLMKNKGTQPLHHENDIKSI